MYYLFVNLLAEAVVPFAVLWSQGIPELHWQSQQVRNLLAQLPQKAGDEAKGAPAESLRERGRGRGGEREIEGHKEIKYKKKRKERMKGIIKK